MTNCKNCQTKINGKYCSNCGQAASLKRIDGHYLIHEIEHILHFERGILFTLKELLIRPAESVKEFIFESRNRLVKPIIFIIITSLVYTLINQYLHVEVGFIHLRGEAPSTISKIFKWVEAHYGYANIFFGLFIAAFVKFFFRKYDYNFFEILILLCYIVGIQMLIFSIFTVIAKIFKIEIMVFAAVLSLTYLTWAIAVFFDKKKVLNYVKAFFAYILGMIASTTFLVLIGVIIDEIRRLKS